MCVCVYVYTRVHVLSCYVSTEHVCVPVYVPEYASVRVDVCGTFVCMYVYTCVYVRVCM